MLNKIPCPHQPSLSGPTPMTWLQLAPPISSRLSRICSFHNRRRNQQERTPIRSQEMRKKKALHPTPAARAGRLDRLHPKPYQSHAPFYPVKYVRIPKPPRPPPKVRDTMGSEIRHHRLRSIQSPKNEMMVMTRKPGWIPFMNQYRHCRLLLHHYYWSDNPAFQPTRPCSAM